MNAKRRQSEPVGLGPADERLRRLRREYEELELENERLRRRLMKANETISYQLGAALLQGAKSLEGFIALPRTLWELRRETVARRARKVAPEANDKPSTSERLWAVAQDRARKARWQS